MSRSGSLNRVSVGLELWLSKIPSLQPDADISQITVGENMF